MLFDLQTRQEAMSQNTRVLQVKGRAITHINENYLKKVK